LLNCVFAVLCLLLCTYLYVPRSSWAIPAGLLTLIVLASMPTRETILLGQINFVAFFLCLAAFIASGRQHPYLAGCLLAVAAWIKVTPILLLIYFLYHKRNWRVLGGFLLASFGFATWAVAAIGLQESVRYVTRILPSAGLSQLSLRNKSFLAMFDRLFGSNPLMTPVIDLPWLAMALKGGFVMALFYGAYRLRRRVTEDVKRDPETSDRFLYAAMLVVMLLCQPLLEIHHLVFVCPALAFISGSVLRRHPVGIGIAAGIVMAMLNSRGWNVFAKLGDHWTLVFLIAPQAWGLLLLGALLAFCSYWKWLPRLSRTPS